MIIKVIPETDSEKARLKEVTHSHVNEFFMFGNKKDDDEDLVDFHDWTGSYRYLIGSLYYFTSTIETEEFSKKSSGTEIPLQIAAPQPKMMKFGDGQKPFGPPQAEIDTDKSPIIEVEPTQGGNSLSAEEEVVADLGIDNTSHQLRLVREQELDPQEETDGANATE